MHDETVLKKVYDIFDKAAFVQDLGIRITNVAPGMCETEIDISRRHQQQHEFIHAGVQATLADHTAGGAATTLVDEAERGLTVEFKINFLRPAVGEKLRCVSKVLRQGKTISVAESEVFAVRQNQSKLVAKAMVTLAIVQEG